MRFPQIAFLIACGILFVFPVASQSPNGTINGLVLDPSAGAVVGAAIVIVNDSTGVQYSSKTNDEGEQRVCFLFVYAVDTQQFVA